MNDLGLRALPASSSSLRDPAGRLIATQGRLIRLIHKSWIPHVQAFLNSQTARELSRSGKLVSSRVLDTASAAEILAEETFADLCPADELGMVLEHEPVFFPSFAHEWPAEMLHAAGQLTLELARSLLREGLGIKDATPYNVLFSGSQLVFVDVLSVEQRDPHDPVWLPYAQFARTFLLPLLAHREFAMPVHQIFLSRRDGLEPSEFYRWSGPFQKLLPPTLTLSSIPTWFHSRAEASDSSMYQARRLRNPAQARFVLESLFKRLSRTLERLKPPCRKSSRWSDYMLLQRSYTPENFDFKQSFIQEALARYQPKRVLDVGCNTGHFSFLAAKAGASVVAIDYDPLVVGQVWRQAHAEKLDILPLVVNLARPTPASGWRNREHPSFLERAHGSFDAVLMLAVIHHLLVTDGIPLPEILAVAAELTTRICVAEFVGPGDPFFRRLLRGRDTLYEGLGTAEFEAACRPYFQIIRSIRVGSSDRWLYLLEKKS